MDQTQLIATAVGVAFIGLFCLLGVNRALGRRRAYLRELAATQAGQVTPTVAYQRYSQGSARRATGAFRVIMVFVFAAIAFQVYITIIMPDGAVTLLNEIYDAQYVFFLLLAPAVLLPAWLYTLLVAAWADGPALVNLRGLRVRPAELVTLRLKAGVINLLPLLLVVEFAAALYALGINGWISFVVFIVGVIALAYFVMAIGPTAVRWYYPCELIEQTQWAELGARVQAWARLAGVPIREVYVRHTERFGVVDGATAGRRPQTLFFSDAFLANSEWRQRDALICLLLAVSDRQRRQNGRQRQNRLRLNGVRLLLFLAIILFLVVSLGLSSQIIQALAQVVPFTAAVILLDVLPIILILLVLVVILVSSRRQQGQVANLFTSNDTAAVALCGDPLALMAVILGINLMSGVAVDRRANPRLPSPLDRVGGIERTLLQPGSYAPWAAQPIPSLAPVQMGPYTLSVPLSPAAQAERPGPVPLAPYSATNSPWAAMPTMPAPTPYAVYAPTPYAQPTPPTTA